MFITIIAIGIEAPSAVVQASTTAAFATAFGSVTNIIFPYAGHVAFFSFISELKDPNEYMKALFHVARRGISIVSPRSNCHLPIRRTRCLLSVAWFDSSGGAEGCIWHCSASVSYVP